MLEQAGIGPGSQVLAVGTDAALVGDTEPLAEGARRLPAAALVGDRDLLVHGVDLLERQALGLVDEEVDEGDAPEAAPEPDEEDLGLQVGVALAVVDEVGCAIGDGPVEKPL